jgi:hypothetical protein
MRRWPDTPAGLIRYFDVGNADAVLVTSLPALREVLHEKCYSFQKPAFFKRLVADMVGYGLVFTEGEEHKRQRRLLAGLFSPANLRALVPLFRDKARHMSDRLDRVIEGEEEGVVDGKVDSYQKVVSIGISDISLTSGLPLLQNYARYYGRLRTRRRAGLSGAGQQHGRQFI